jgi:hypothetical protein
MSSSHHLFSSGNLNTDLAIIVGICTYFKSQRNAIALFFGFSPQEEIKPILCEPTAIVQSTVTTDKPLQ